MNNKRCRCELDENHLRSDCQDLRRSMGLTYMGREGVVRPDSYPSSKLFNSGFSVYNSPGITPPPTLLSTPQSPKPDTVTTNFHTPVTITRYDTTNDLSKTEAGKEKEEAVGRNGQKISKTKTKKNAGGGGEAHPFTHPNGYVSHPRKDCLCQCKAYPQSHTQGFCQALKDVTP